MAQASAAAAAKSKKRKIRWRDCIPYYLLALPGIIYMLCNNYLPMFGIIIAFKNLNFRKGILGSDWCGFDNFKFLFASKDAWAITRNTILYNLAFIILTTVISVAVAILINEIKSRTAGKLYQSLILLPYLMSWVIVSYLAYALLSGETGMINNSIFKALGIKTVSWYNEPKYWPFILTFVHLWKTVGYAMIIYYSSIVGMSQDYFEAATLDGASKWQQIRYLTLPLLKSTMITMFVLQVGRIFYSDFGLFYQIPMNSGTLYSVTRTIDVYVYNALMKSSDFGMSSAASVYQSIVGFVLIVAVNALLRKTSKENALF
ncbi:MAG: sugar ABC transporter permease [Lachnospiraceae bacterium]|nr:sugar ABC transporter permease [Lachnospiraceae bacterium]